MPRRSARPNPGKARSRARPWPPSTVCLQRKAPADPLPKRSASRPNSIGNSLTHRMKKTSSLKSPQSSSRSKSPKRWHGWREFETCSARNAKDQFRRNRFRSSKANSQPGQARLQQGRDSRQTIELQSAKVPSLFRSRCRSATEHVRSNSWIRFTPNSGCLVPNSISRTSRSASHSRTRVRAWCRRPTMSGWLMRWRQWPKQRAGARSVFQGIQTSSGKFGWKAACEGSRCGGSSLNRKTWTNSTRAWIGDHAMSWPMSLRRPFRNPSRQQTGHRVCQPLRQLPGSHKGRDRPLHLTTALCMSLPSPMHPLTGPKLSLLSPKL